jgi:hypothetical protein
MDRSLRRRGQVLVVVGALLGVVIGVALGLVVEDAETNRAMAAPRRERGAALAASPPSSQPPASGAASSGNRADGNGSAAKQRTEAADRPDKRDSKARKDGEDDRHKSGGRGKDKPGKGKDK